jgi:hypothetical protein
MDGERTSRTRSTRVRIGGAVATVLGAAAMLMAFGAPAGADGGSTSPPAGSVPTSCSTSSTLNVGPSGQPAQVTLGETCAYTPNSAVTVTFNGAVVAHATANSSGLVTLIFDGKDAAIAVDNGTYTPTTYGVNTFVASGTNASGASNTADFLIDLEHIVTAASAVTPPSISSSSATGALAFTGADLAALVAAGLALVLLGGGIVLYTRRRAAEYRSTI